VNDRLPLLRRLGGVLVALVAVGHAVTSPFRFKSRNLALSKSAWTLLKAS
jgi:hypothetical protein